MLLILKYLLSYKFTSSNIIIMLKNIFYNISILHIYFYNGLQIY